MCNGDYTCNCTFFNTNTSCNKCSDVHNAQRAGLQSKSCECSCHGGYSYYPNYTYTVTGTFDTNNTSESIKFCDATGCSTINLNNE